MSQLIHYSKKGAPYLKTDGRCDETVSGLISTEPRAVNFRYHEGCAIRGCPNTFDSLPARIFLPFPQHGVHKTRWLRVAGLDSARSLPNELYCCEDHFDLKRDVRNFSLLRSAYSGVVANLLKEDVVPHRHIHLETPHDIMQQPNSGSSSQWPHPGSSRTSGSPTDDKRPSVIVKQTLPNPSSNGPKIRIKTVEELMRPQPPVASSNFLPKNHDTDSDGTAKSEHSRNTARLLPSSSETDKYKECAVPGCPNNARTFPDQRFVCVPMHAPIRRQWYEAIGRKFQPHARGATHEPRVYICSQHFRDDQLEQYKPSPGGVVSVRAQHGTLPSLHLTPQQTTQSGVPCRIPDSSHHVVQPLAQSSALSTKPSTPSAKSPSNGVDSITHPGVQPANKPVTAVQPRCQKYEPKTMPTYPECRHKDEPDLKCTEVSIVDYSGFHFRFYGLRSRTEQNEFICSHTVANELSSPDDPPSFRFFVDVSKPPGQVQVCASAFAACLSFDITVLISLVTRHFDASRTGTAKSGLMAVPAPVVLKPIKQENEDENDIMIYEQVSETIVLIDSDEEAAKTIKTETNETPANREEVCPVSTSGLPIGELLDVKVEDTDDENRPPPVLTPHAMVSDVTDAAKRKDRETRTHPSSESVQPKEEEGSTGDYQSEDDMGFFESLQICERCLAQFKSQGDIDSHLSRNSCRKFTGAYFNCNACGRTFFTFNDLKYHTSVVHKYVCPKCDDTYRLSRLFEYHVVKCTGTNQLSDKMARLIEYTRMSQMEGGVKGEKRTNDGDTKPKLQKISTRPCVVKIQRLKIPSDCCGPIDVNTMTPVVEPSTEIPRIRIRASPSQGNSSKTNPPELVESDSTEVVTSSPTAGEPVKVDCEEIDIEDTKDFQEEIQPLKKQTAQKKRKRLVSDNSSDEEVIKEYPRGRKANPVTPQSPLRSVRATRKAVVNYGGFYTDSSEDADDPLDDLEFSDGPDPDFDPAKEQRKRRQPAVDSDSDQENWAKKVTEKKKPQKIQIKREESGVDCGICGSYFASIEGLKSHHRMSERCGKFPPGTVFKCKTCQKNFISQTYLDEHRARNKDCKSSNDLALLSCFNCGGSFKSLYTLRFHMRTSNECLDVANKRAYIAEDSSGNACKPTVESVGPKFVKPPSSNYKCNGCNVQFNSALGLGLHLKRSPKCASDNPNVEIPGMANREGIKTEKSKDEAAKDASQELVFVCTKCCASFSSVWGLRTHERTSTNCKPDRPYEIPVPVPKEKADKLKKEYQDKMARETRAAVVDPLDPEAHSSSTAEADDGVKKSARLVVYTLDPQEKRRFGDTNQHKCPSCNAQFTSVWGLRTHQRMSTMCAKKPTDPPPVPKRKSIISEAAAQSLAKGENVCPNCTARFSTAWGLRTHLRNSTLCAEDLGNVKSSGKFSEGLRCFKCHHKCFDLRQLREHFRRSPTCLPPDVTVSQNGRINAGTGHYLCPQCWKTFKIPTSLEQHFVEHAPHREWWPCCKCVKEFADQFSLHRHFHAEHIGEWFCVICNKNPSCAVLKTFKDYYKHICDSHSTDADPSQMTHFKCSSCLRSFESVYSHEVHVVQCKKLAEQIFTCASCAKVFTKKIHITNHMKYAHSGATIDKRFTFKCPHCPRKFLSEKDYTIKHQKEGCRIDEHTCEICGEVYIGLDKLRMHIQLTHAQKRARTTADLPPPDPIPSASDSPAQMESPQSPEPELQTEMKVEVE